MDVLGIGTEITECLRIARMIGHAFTEPIQLFFRQFQHTYYYDCPSCKVLG